MLLKVIFAKQYKEHITELEPADKKIIENIFKNNIICIRITLYIYSYFFF